MKKGIAEEDAFTCIICDITFNKSFESSEIQICKAYKRKEVLMTNAARVFVINHIGKDMSDAKQYGTLIPITEGNVDVFNLDRMQWTIRDCLVKFAYNPGVDYILLSGGLPLNFLVGFICKKYPKTNLLLWDAKNRKYRRKEYKNESLTKD